MAFRIVRNDITKVKADAIVNTANPEVAIGDGVDSAIYEAAGEEKLLCARKKIGYLDIGEVGITKAFQLNAKYIIHSSSPYWIDGMHGEKELLRQCYDKCLKLAYKRRCKSIAFPLLSTGTYGFPKELGLQIALESFYAFLFQHEIEIILVVFGETAFRLSGKIFDDVQEYVDDSYVDHKLKKEYRNNRISMPDREEAFCCPSVMPKKNQSDSSVFSASRPNFSVSGEIDFHDNDKNSLDKKRVQCLKKKTTSISSNLDFYMQQEKGSFGEYLQQMINKKGMKNSEVYTAANITKQYFSKLIKGKVTPSKTKILSLAIALHLNLDETIDFLRMSGYAFSPFSSVDKIFEYFIRNKIYDIYKIDIVLFDYGLPTLVNE